MTLIRKSVPKPPIGSGTPKPKKGKVTIIYCDDVLTSPTRDAKGVKMLGNFVLKAGSKMETIYMTPSSQKFNSEIDGDEDFEGFIKKFEGFYPGDTLEIREFRQNNLGVPVILLFGEGCGEDTGTVLGSVCNPMKLKGNTENTNEFRKTTLIYEQIQKEKLEAGFYNGEITLAANFVAADVDLELTKANGPVQQLPALAITDAITATSIDLDNGTIVSLIGGGGTAPATLDVGVQGLVTVILLNGTQWVALKDAVINLEVVKGGATTYLVERSRA